MAPIKLTYFDVTALGEPIRFLLSYLDKDFVDDRFTEDEWPAIKPTTPWGKSPILQINGQTVTQSVAITRYLGREAGLNGKDAWEDLRIDEIVDVINDLRAEMGKFQYEEDEKRKEEIKGPCLSKTVPFYMTKIDALIKQNKGFLANGKLSWADFYFAGICDYLSFMNGSDILANYPNAKALAKSVYDLPKVKEWIKKRPKTEC